MQHRLLSGPRISSNPNRQPKNVCKFSLLLFPIPCRELGRRWQTSANSDSAPLLCRKPVKEFIDVINAVQPADISKLATKLFKAPLTYGAIGDIANMPRYEEVAKRFK